MRTPEKHRATTDAPRVCSVAQVAQMLGTAPGTLDRAIREGEFPAVRIRGRLIVPAKAVEAMVDTAVAEQTVVDASVGAAAGAAPMSAISTPIRDRSQAAIEHVQRCRERVLADRPDAERSTVAELHEREAHLWSLLVQHTRVDVHWRAALAAEAYARHCARYLIDAAGRVPGEAARS